MEELLAAYQKGPLNNDGSHRIFNAYLSGNTGFQVDFFKAIDIRPPSFGEMKEYLHAVIQSSPFYDPDSKRKVAIDMGGTGDNLGLIDAHLGAAILLSASNMIDIPILKYGTWGATSGAVSDDILNIWGAHVPETRREIDAMFSDIGFGYVSPVKAYPHREKSRDAERETGKSLFDYLGILANPLKPTIVSMGTSTQLAFDFASQYLSGMHAYSIAMGISPEGNMGGVSLSGPTIFTRKDYRAIWDKKEEDIRNKGYPHIPVSELQVEDVAANAKAIDDVLRGNGTDAHTDFIIAQAALGVKLRNPCFRFESSRKHFRKLIKEGTAARTLDKILAYKP